MDVDNRLVDTVGKEKSGTDGESSINMYTTVCEIHNREELLYNTGRPL